MPKFIIVYILFAMTAMVITFHKDVAVATNRPFSEFPQNVLSWQMVNQNEFSAEILKVLKPTDYLYRQYKDTDGKVLSLYIGYHDGGSGGGEIHSPKNCLPGSGWFEASSQRGVLSTSHGTINLVRAVYQKGDSKELFLYWFQVRDRSISDEYSLKVAEITNSVMSGRRDASFIRISLPIESSYDQALAKGEQFIRDIEPAFRAFLPH
jgi:EpsI family protein